MAQRDVIRAIEGQVCWSAWQGYGSVLFFDFGEPKVYVHPRVTQLGRLASVEGTWSICIEYSSWRISMCGELLARSDSSRPRVASALKKIRGQAFLGAQKHRGAHCLDFDLGGRIEVRPLRDTVTWPRTTTVMWYARERGVASQSWLADAGRCSKPTETTASETLAIL